MKEILQTKVINSLITLKACEPRCYLDAYSLSFVVNILAYHVDYNLMPPSTKKSHLGDKTHQASKKLTFPFEQGKHRRILLPLGLLLCNSLNYALVCALMYRSSMKS
jgi:hypothetical protein